MVLEVQSTLSVDHSGSFSVNCNGCSFVNHRGPYVDLSFPLNKTLIDSLIDGFCEYDVKTGCKFGSQTIIECSVKKRWFIIQAVTIAENALKHVFVSCVCGPG